MIVKYIQRKRCGIALHKALLLACLLQTSWIVAQEQIIAVRLRPAGSVVTVRGIVLNGAELGPIRFLQDSTAALAVYPGGASPQSFQQVKTGDEVEITGVLTLYRGLLEINPILSFTVRSQGNPLPEPVTLQAREIGFHDQGKLVRIPCMQFRYVPGRFEWGTHPAVTAYGDRIRVDLENSNPLIGSNIPHEVTDLIVIASWFDNLSLLPRSSHDLLPASCVSVSAPRQSEITQSGFRLEWNANVTSEGLCVITTLDGSADTLFASGMQQSHELWIDHLTPAEFYDVKVGVIAEEGQAWYPDVRMSTASATAGSIAVYFNNPVNTTFSNGALPHGTSFAAMLESVKQVIINARNTLDVAMYNSNRADIIQELQKAQQRGVRIRFIADGGQSNGALNPPPGFPLMYRQGDGIMHHKFVLADAHDAQYATLWTGSTNHSTGQLATDPNNTLVIRDHALAKAYLMEFEEMWGSSSDLPDPLTSRTGSAKRDDTPHLFQIGDHLVESFFSPSDNTHHEILSACRDATAHLDAGLLLLTRYDLAETMAQLAQQGRRVRVIIDDRESSLVPMQILESGGALVAHHAFNSIFHHKYAVIDEGQPTARVITGSHNWTTSAAVRNDENTLILHDPDIANIYRQEFEARWSEVFTSVVDPGQKDDDVLFFPNPSTDWIEVWSAETFDELVIYSLTGIPVIRQSGDLQRISLVSLVPGMYVIETRSHRGHAHRQLVVRI